MIILEIIKIIAIIIGCIAGCVLLLLLLLTLRPFRYKIILTKECGTFLVNGTVRWMLGFASIKCTYIDKKLKYYIRIAGFKAIDSENDQGKAQKQKKKANNKTKPAVVTEPSSKKKNPEKKELKKASHKKFSKNIIKKIKNIVQITRDDSFKPALKHVRIELLNLLSHIRPRKISGNLSFGLESPDKTALAYAAAANIINIVNADVMVEPDMDDQRLDCDIKAQGRLYLGYIIVMAVRLFFDNEFKTFVKKLRSI